jgi:hypothetical protein
MMEAVEAEVILGVEEGEEVHHLQDPRNAM